MTEVLAFITGIFVCVAVRIISPERESWRVLVASVLLFAAMTITAVVMGRNP